MLTFTCFVHVMLGQGWGGSGWDVNVHLHVRHACDGTSGLGWGRGGTVTFTCTCVMHVMLRQGWGGVGVNVHLHLHHACDAVMLGQAWGGVGVGMGAMLTFTFTES